MSSSVLLSQNKILAYFNLDTSTNIQPQPILQPSTYTTTIHHNHYPIIYYNQIHKHFQHCLPKQTQPGNLRLLIHNKQQIPSQLPIGLFIDKSVPVCFTVRIDLSVTLPDAFIVIKNSWKKAFQVVNQNRRCDYVKNRLSKEQLRKKFQLYVNGVGHGLQAEGLYEGTHVIVKGFFEGCVIERKYRVSTYNTVWQIASDIFALDQQALNDIKTGKLLLKTHGICVDLDLSSKTFLDQWSYNDGYCYLKLELPEQSAKQ